MSAVVVANTLPAPIIAAQNTVSSPAPFT